MPHLRPTSTVSVILALALLGCGGGAGGGSVLQTPTVAQAPAAVTTGVGGSVVFHVRAKGGRLTYQWLKDGAVIIGATKADYTIRAVTLDSAGIYSVRIENPKGSVVSEGALLTVSSGPVIVDGPHDVAAAVGKPATFSVFARGDQPLTYQWYQNGVAIPSANSSTLTLLAVAPTDAGAYSVVITNAKGSTNSPPATLTILLPPAIVKQPLAATVDVGAPATLAVTAEGTAPLAYRWTKDGVEIVGATSATLAIPNAAPGDAGAYRCVVENVAGSATSEPAVLTVVTIPLVVTPPISVAVRNGDRAAFSVVARGGQPLAYRWRKNGADIPGADAATYEIPAATTGDAGLYDVVVTNGYGSTISPGATLKIGFPPTIAGAPFLFASKVGVSVNGTGPFSYHWQFDHRNAGTQAQIAYRGHGNYSVTVSNAYGSAGAGAAL